MMFLIETSLKGFSASKCNVGNWIFSKLELFEKLFGFLRDFWGELFGLFLDFSGGFFGGFFLEDLFWRIFFGGSFLEDFFGGFFLEDFFWEDLLGGLYLEEFFVYIVKVS